MSNASEHTIETWPQTGLGMESQDNKPERTVEASGGVDAIENGEIYVSWDGPEDPANPRNWCLSKKSRHILLVALITFMTCEPSLRFLTKFLFANFNRPFASSMVAPAIPQLKSQLHFENNILGSFIVSIYLLGYVFGPLVVAPLSEMYGRVPIYHFCNIGFIVTSIACAVSSNVHMLIGFRFLSGTFGSSPVAYVEGNHAINIPLKFNHARKLTENQTWCRNDL